MRLVQRPVALEEESLPFIHIWNHRQSPLITLIIVDDIKGSVSYIAHILHTLVHLDVEGVLIRIGTPSVLVHLVFCTALSDAEVITTAQTVVILSEMIQGEVSFTEAHVDHENTH